MKKILQNAVHSAFRRAAASGALPDHLLAPEDIPVTVPSPSFGDFATPVCLNVAKELGVSPREAATILVNHFDREEVGAAGVEIAGPGFINFRMLPVFWHRLAVHLFSKKGLSVEPVGKGVKVQVEFVSANPTGPLHIGHARNAVVGDVVANLLSAAGFEVQREYYLNDYGTQMNTLGRSVLARYRESLGKPASIPDDGYQGEYIREIAAEAVDKWGDRYLETGDEDALPVFRKLAEEAILNDIREDLERFGVRFDNWYRESDLHRRGAVEDAIRRAKKQGLAYEDDGAVWFATSRFGDDKDRVMLRSSGETTYFASDIAYHREKFDRGFDRVIDVWGADHHGYIPRMKAALKAFGHSDGVFEVILVTLVNLLRGGKTVSMSTRAGEFLTLREILDEVGVDASRFFLLRRRSDSPLDFDLDLAVRQSQENPVYYVQYGHARICSIFAKAAEEGYLRPTKAPDLSPLKEEEEFRLIRQVGFFPDIVQEAAACLEPHRLPFYLEELVGMFHPYYNRHRVIVEDDPDLTAARLFLVDLIDKVIVKGLTLLGVSAPERM